MKRAGSKRPKSGVVKIGRASGRVKCFIRVRPLNDDELEREDELAVEVSQDKKEVIVNDTRVGLVKNFQFDHVFPPETTNTQISSFISKPLVNAALNGFNGTVMAYGQTGSGKTYTLMSTDGVAATIIEKSFKKMATKENLQYKVSMSYLQIYQEKIYDLLNNATSNKIDLTIREHPEKGVYVENLSEYVVRSPEAVLSLLQLGKKRLIFAETKMNRTSSRSHSVCILSIERSSKSSAQSDSPTTTKKPCNKKLLEVNDTLTNSHHSSEPSLYHQESSDDEDEDDALSKMMAFNKDVVLKGHLYICDLAGSERIKKTNAEGERLSEAQHINLSLLELGNVIQALAEGAESGHPGHIPFRNSTLTRLLQESLGGNCKTSLVVCCSPSDLHVHETKCSLNFGSRAMKIKNTAFVNVEMDYKKLSEDLAKLVDAREKQIEDLKVSQQHELDLRRKEAEMAAEMKFGDGLNEARKAYVALKLLMDTQANSHAENMSQLQAKLSREKDSNLALQAELSKKRDSSNDQHCKTKCLLLTEVLSMQLFYTLQCSAEKPEQSEMFDQVSRELVKQDVLGTQEDILENVDNLIGVLGTYLNLTEKEFSDVEDEEFYIDEEDDFSTMGDLDGKISGLQSLVIKIRKRLKVLKDSVDGRTLRFLNGIVDRKDRKSMENMKDVYQILQKLLTARNESSDPEFLDNSKDAERCLTYVLLDKALLCCLVVLDKYESERKLLELGSENEVLIEELETSRGRNKSFKKDNERLIAQLERRRGERELSDAQADTPSESNQKTIEKLLKHNAKLQLEVEELRKTPGAKRGHSEVSRSDVELFYLRQQVTKLTRENEKLEFMMKVMGERFSQGGSEEPTKDMETDISQNEISVTASREKAKAERPRIDEKTMENKMEDKKETGTSTSPSTSVGGRSKTVYTVEDTHIKEQLLTRKIEADKTLKQLIVIKVDQQIKSLDSPNTSVSCDASTEPDPERKKLDRLLDTAIESAHSVGMNTGLMLNSSLEDIEALERDVNAMKVNNEALGRQCLSLVSDRQTLEVLLSDLRSNIAGLQENVVNKYTPISSSFPSFIPNFTQSNEENEAEVRTEMFTCSTTTESPLKKVQVKKISSSSDPENERVEVSLREFTTRDCQTDVTLVPDAENYFSESDGVEEKEGETTSVVVQRLMNKYNLVKQLVKHLEAEIRQFKIRTTALETELKERQHLKDENLLLEEEVKELQGLKIYLESQLAEGGGGETDEAYDSFSRDEEESNLSKWKDFEKRDSFLDFSGSSNFSASTLNLASTPIYKANYRGMSQSMMDLSQPQMYTSFSSLKSARGSFGSLKMLKLEMEGQPSRIRDKLKSASLLLQHTGSLESQLKSSRQKCFRLEGEVCKLIKEKKELNEELDKMRAKLREEAMHDIGLDPVDPVDKPSDESPFGSKTKRRSFRFKRAGKEEKDRLKNELTLAKEQLSKLKSQLVMPSQTVTDSTQKWSPYMSLSEDEKRREKELALTRERCLILAEELGASNKEKIKLGDDLEEALDNIDVLANEIKRLGLVDEQKRRLEVRLSEMEDKLAKTAEGQSSEKNNEDLDLLKLDIVELLGEKSKLEESVTELRWEKERLNEMESIVQRLMQVEKEKKQVELTKQGKDGNYEEYQESVELIRLKNENEQLKDELEVLKERVLDLELELDKSSENTSLTQVLSAVKDKRSKTAKSAQNKVDIGSRGGTMSTKSRSGSDIKLGRGARSTNDQSKERKEESRSGSERRSRPKVLASLFH